MRVISGFLKSRKIEGDNIEGTRPTMDRVKSSLFATIYPKLNESVCLDLFAGSGALGIEAISNGAKKVFFCDNNKKCINVINKNITNFKIEEYSKVYLGDYKNIIEKLGNDRTKFDIVFLDPPYRMNIVNEILEILVAKKLLNKEAIVVVEYSNVIPEINSNYEITKEKKYGDKFIRIYKYLQKQ